jgi:hypothetical protein
MVCCRYGINAVVPPPTRCERSDPVERAGIVGPHLRLDNKVTSPLSAHRGAVVAVAPIRKPPFWTLGRRTPVPDRGHSETEQAPTPAADVPTPAARFRLVSGCGKHAEANIPTERSPPELRRRPTGQLVRTTRHLDARSPGLTCRQVVSHERDQRSQLHEQPHRRVAVSSEGNSDDDFRIVGHG